MTSDAPAPATRDTNARLACGLGIAAGALTLPLNGVLVLIPWGVGLVAPWLVGPVGQTVIEGAARWGSAVGLLLAAAAFVLGGAVRRAMDAGRRPASDVALARAGELMGAIVLPIAAFLVIGNVRYVFRG